MTEGKGQLRVKWGEGSEMQCTVSYVLMPQTKGQMQEQMQQFNSPCTAAKSADFQGAKLANNVAISAVNHG